MVRRRQRVVLKRSAREASRASRAQRRTPMLGVLAFAALATAVAARGERRGSVGEPTTPFVRTESAAGDSAPPMTLVVVAQRRDCEGNLSFASYFGRARVRRGVVVRTLLIEGRAPDTLGLRARLPPVLRGVRMALLEPREREALRAMGHGATPVFLLFDSENRIVAAIPVDADPVHRTAFQRAIAHLVNYDPTS